MVWSFFITIPEIARSFCHNESVPMAIHPEQPGAVNKDADMTDSASGGEQMIPGTQGKPSNFSGSQYTEARTNMTGHGKYSVVPL